MRSPNGAVVAELQNLARAVHRKLDRRLTLRRGEVTVSPFGRPARFKVRNSLDYARLVVGSDELEVLGALIERLRPDDLFWDVGGHLGLFSVHVAQAIGADRVIAFEPDPEYAASLRTNLDLNGLQAVRIQTCALADKPRTDTLHTAGTSGPSSSLGNQTQHQPNAVQVRVESADSLVASGLDAPTVMKVDIEGAEALLLRGATELLTGSRRPRLIFMEVHPEWLHQFDSSLTEVLRTLLDAGYTVGDVISRYNQLHLTATLPSEG